MPRNDKPRGGFGKSRSEGGAKPRHGKPRSNRDASRGENSSGERPKKKFSSERPEGRDRKPFSKDGRNSDRSKRTFSDRSDSRTGERSDKAYTPKGGRPDRDRKAEDRPKRHFSDRSENRSEERSERKPFRPREDRPDRDSGRSSRPLRKSVPTQHMGPAPKLQKIERNKPERLAKFIARCGVASRRGSEQLIEEGHVQVNGKRVTSPALNVTMQDVVTVHGKQLVAEAEARIFLYYKPVGLVTTHKDPEGRPTVFASLPKAMPRVISVGRLDVNSEGLLLLTTSGDLAHQLEDPKQGWQRSYRVRAYGMLTEAQMQIIRNGITIDGLRYRGADIECEGRGDGKNAWYAMTIYEGKNREIRKIFENFDCKVSRLIRVSFGNLQLGAMRPGDIQEVSLSLLEGNRGRR